MHLIAPRSHSNFPSFSRATALRDRSFARRALLRVPPIAAKYGRLMRSLAYEWDYYRKVELELIQRYGPIRFHFGPWSPIWISDRSAFTRRFRFSSRLSPRRTYVPTEIKRTPHFPFCVSSSFFSPSPLPSPSTRPPSPSRSFSPRSGYTRYARTYTRPEFRMQGTSGMPLARLIATTLWSVGREPG